MRRFRSIVVSVRNDILIVLGSVVYFQFFFCFKYKLLTCRKIIFFHFVGHIMMRDTFTLNEFSPINGLPKRWTALIGGHSFLHQTRSKYHKILYN